VRTHKPQIKLEIKQRMAKRFGWLLGAVALVLIGLLVACGSYYNASSDGLLIVGSQGSGLLETFAFTLNSGSIYAVSNNPNDTSNDVCVLNGVPSSIVVDPAGAYAYTIINANSLCDTDPTKPSTTGILAFKINSDGTTTQVGSQVPFLPSAGMAVFPGTMVMDPSGKFLFVADRATNPYGGGPQVSGAISVFLIGSGGSITEVSGSPYVPTVQSTIPQAIIDIVGVAPTPTVLPAVGLNGVQQAVCSDVGNNPPTLEYLYAVDGLGNQVFEFSVNTTTGVLTNPSTASYEPAFPTDTTPAGVAVDPCNRFVYVSDSLTNKVSAYAMCNGTVTSPSQACMNLNIPSGLVQVPGSPFSLPGSTNGPGPLLVDPYGNFVYVLGTLSNTINPLKIAPISGALAPVNPATVATGIGPVSMVIRSDDSWLFVANHGSPGVGGNTVSQYAITPQSGALSSQPAIQTDNYPWGVAVK
jgi:6-phosphogluconolactonase (cycloisomerase 2 family)